MFSLGVAVDILPSFFSRFCYKECKESFLAHILTFFSLRPSPI